MILTFELTFKQVKYSNLILNFSSDKRIINPEQRVHLCVVSYTRYRKMGLFISFILWVVSAISYRKNMSTSIVKFYHFIRESISTNSCIQCILLLQIAYCNKTENKYMVCVFCIIKSQAFLYMLRSLVLCKYLREHYTPLHL